MLITSHSVISDATLGEVSSRSTRLRKPLVSPAADGELVERVAVGLAGGAQLRADPHLVGGGHRERSHRMFLLRQLLLHDISAEPLTSHDRRHDARMTTFVVPHETTHSGDDHEASPRLVPALGRPRRHRSPPAAPRPTTPVRLPTTEPTAEVGDAREGRRDRRHAARPTSRTPGVVRVASGVSFPPMEYFDTDNKTVLGFDADLGKALGEVLGVEFEFQNTNFDGIIGGLNAGRYDLSLTSMIDKKERQAEVDFVDYLNSGVTFMVLKGNPEGLTEQARPVRQDRGGREGRRPATSSPTTSAPSARRTARSRVDKQPFPDQASAVQALQVRPCGRRARARPDPGLQREAEPGRLRGPGRAVRRCCRSASRCRRTTPSCATPCRPR